MSTEANKILVRRWAEEVLSKGNLSAIDELFAAHLVQPTNPAGLAAGIPGHKHLNGVYSSAFPDFRFTVEQEIAEGDLVVVRGSYQMTHHGEFFWHCPYREARDGNRDASV